MPDILVEPIQVVVSPQSTNIVVATNVLVDNTGGGSGNVIAERPFSWNDVNILPIDTAVNERVIRVLLLIDTAFDDPTATLSVGDTGNTVRLQNTSENLPSVGGTYMSMPNYRYLVSTAVNLYISPAGASQGSGIVYLLRN